MVNGVAREELTADEWKLIEPFQPKGGSGPHPERLRQQLDGTIAETDRRGRIDLSLVSVDSTVVRAHDCDSVIWPSGLPGRANASRAAPQAQVGGMITQPASSSPGSCQGSW